MDTADTQHWRFPALNSYILVLFPLLGALCFFLWAIFGFDQAEWVFGVIFMLNLLAVIVHMLDKRNHGQLVIYTQDDKRIFSLELGIDPMTIEKYDSITFDVVYKNADYVDLEAALTGDQKPQPPESQIKHGL